MPAPRGSHRYRKSQLRAWQLLERARAAPPLEPLSPGAVGAETLLVSSGRAEDAPVRAAGPDALSTFACLALVAPGTVAPEAAPGRDTLRMQAALPLLPRGHRALAGAAASAAARLLAGGPGLDVGARATAELVGSGLFESLSSAGTGGLDSRAAACWLAMLEGHLEHADPAHRAAVDRYAESGPLDMLQRSRRPGGDRALALPQTQFALLWSAAVAPGRAGGPAQSASWTRAAECLLYEALRAAAPDTRALRRHVSARILADELWSREVRRPRPRVERSAAVRAALERGAGLRECREALRAACDPRPAESDPPSCLSPATLAALRSDAEGWIDHGGSAQLEVIDPSTVPAATGLARPRPDLAAVRSALAASLILGTTRSAALDPAAPVRGVREGARRVLRRVLQAGPAPAGGAVPDSTREREDGEVALVRGVLDQCLNKLPWMMLCVAFDHPGSLAAGGLHRAVRGALPPTERQRQALAARVRETLDDLLGEHAPGREPPGLLQLAAAEGHFEALLPRLLRETAEAPPALRRSLPVEVLRTVWRELPPAHARPAAVAALAAALAAAGRPLEPAQVRRKRGLPADLPSPASGASRFQRQLRPHLERAMQLRSRLARAEGQKEEPRPREFYWLTPGTLRLLAAALGPDEVEAEVSLHLLLEVVLAHRGALLLVFSLEARWLAVGLGPDARPLEM
eukprot:g4328.t1